MKKNIWMLLLFMMTAACSLAPTEPTATITPTASLTPSPTPLPPSATPSPTETPLPTLLDELGFEDCVRWDTVTGDTVGTAMCVYGVVSTIENLELWQITEEITRNLSDGNFYIHFSEDTRELSAHFRINAFDYYYPEVEVGNCIAVVGIVRSYGPTSFLYINPAASNYDSELFIWPQGEFCP